MGRLKGDICVSPYSGSMNTRHQTSFCLIQFDTQFLPEWEVQRPSGLGVPGQRQSFGPVLSSPENEGHAHCLEPLSCREMRDNSRGKKRKTSTQFVKDLKCEFEKSLDENLFKTINISDFLHTDVILQCI